MVVQGNRFEGRELFKMEKYISFMVACNNVEFIICNLLVMIFLLYFIVFLIDIA